MYCKNCGEQLGDGVNFCFSCGCKAGEGHGYCSNCGVKSTGAVACTNCGNIIEEFKEEPKQEYSNQSQAYNYNQNGQQYSQNGQQYNQNYQQGTVNYNGKKPKSKIAAGILGILVGGLGIHRFYLGYVGIGILQIVVTVITCGAGSIWGFIEGILILCGSTITTDADGVPLSDN